MKALIYKRPVFSTMCIDLLFLFICILIIKYDLGILFAVIFPILGVINRKILINGIGVKKINKIIIIINMVMTIVVVVVYNYYTIINRIINYR